MLGILVEKPSAARNFASALGGMKGTFNGESYVIVAARGHLFELAGPDEQVAPGLAARYKSWKLDNLPWTETDFTWKRVKKKDTAQTLRDIKHKHVLSVRWLAGMPIESAARPFR